MSIDSVSPDNDPSGGPFDHGSIDPELIRGMLKPGVPVRGRAEENHNSPVFDGTSSGFARFVTEGEVRSDAPANKKPS